MVLENSKIVTSGPAYARGNASIVILTVSVIIQGPVTWNTYSITPGAVGVIVIESKFPIEIIPGNSNHSTLVNVPPGIPIKLTGVPIQYVVSLPASDSTVSVAHIIIESIILQLL